MMNTTPPTYRYSSKKNDSYIIETQGKIIFYCEVLRGTKRISNFFWCISLFFFGLGFFITGLLSYIVYSRNIIFLIDCSNILFIPQGILLIFYGVCSILLSFLLFLSIKLEIGAGTNVYDFENKVIRIVRKGFPKTINFFKYTQSRFYVVYPFSEINNLELKITSGLNPERMCYLVLKDKRRIPLNINMRIEDLNFLETRAIFLAKLLKIELKLNNQ